MRPLSVTAALLLTLVVAVPVLAHAGKSSCNLSGPGGDVGTGKAGAFVLRRSRGA